MSSGSLHPLPCKGRCLVLGQQKCVDPVRATLGVRVWSSRCCIEARGKEILLTQERAVCVSSACLPKCAVGSVFMCVWKAVYNHCDWV